MSVNRKVKRSQKKRANPDQELIDSLLGMKQEVDKTIVVIDQHTTTISNLVKSLQEKSILTDIDKLNGIKSTLERERVAILKLKDDIDPTINEFGKDAFEAGMKTFELISELGRVTMTISNTIEDFYTLTTNKITPDNVTADGVPFTEEEKQQ